MIQKHRRKQAAIVAGVGLGVAATLWGMKRWRQLKETPPVSPHSHHAGLAGYYQQIGDWRMFTRVTPNEDQGLPVVLIHGLVMSGRAMEPLALALGRDYHVLVPDLPGFGASTLPPSAPIMSVDQLADALWLWLQHNGFQRAIWVGNSFGCQILAALAVKHPQAVAGTGAPGAAGGPPAPRPAPPPPPLSSALPASSRVRQGIRLSCAAMSRYPSAQPSSARSPLPTTISGGKACSHAIAARSRARLSLSAAA